MSRPEVHVVRTVAELEALEGEWNTLSESFAMPLLDHEWFLAAARTLHDEADLRVVLVRHTGALTGIAPMVVDRSLGGRLALLGASTLYEPGGWLYATDDALTALARAVLGMGHVTVIQRVARESVLCRRLPAIVRGSGVAFTRPVAASFSVQTTASWDEYLETLSARTRRRMATLQSRAGLEGFPVSVSRRHPGPEEATEAVGGVAVIEGTGWKGRRGSALAARADLRKFFECYARLAAAKGRLCVSTLSCGTVHAAAELAVEAYGRLWGLKIAFDERFARHAPALQLVHASIRYASETGLTSYEFLGSAEPWQERWKPTRREYQVALVYPFTFRALFEVLSDAAGHIARQSRDLRARRAIGLRARSAGDGPAPLTATTVRVR